MLSDLLRFLKSSILHSHCAGQGAFFWTRPRSTKLHAFLCRSPASCSCAVGPELIVRLVKALREHKIEGAIDHLQLRQARGQAGAVSLTPNLLGRVCR